MIKSNLPSSQTMHHTVFDTPIIKPFLKMVSLSILKIIGWKAVDKSEDKKKYVVIAAPHTSNWDFPLFLIVAFALNMKAYWLGKHTLFRWPLRGLFRWLGGIPVDRTKKTNLVQQCVNHFNATMDLVIVNAPEGTRSKVHEWKTGFYYIATGAGVPSLWDFLITRRKKAASTVCSSQPEISIPT